MTASPPDGLPTDLVAGKYRVTRLIGQGGMGSVWEGIHSTLGTRVAIKFIDAAFADSEEARSRFENEARAAARLNSKYAVQVYDHGVMPDGRPFIVMEFLKGEPLDSRLDRQPRLPPGETARIINQVSRALGRAHSAGIVHRDLKPENIFLVWDEEDQAHVAKVVDFGIAKFTEPQSGVSSSTRTGSVLGTPYYMSPEQARGLRGVDCRSDLWSLGVIAFRCIVGRLPFEGEAIGDLLVKICTAPIPVPSQWADGVPPMFDGWFARVMQRDPALRYATVAELAEQLNVACGVTRAPMGSANMDVAPPVGGMVRPGTTTPVDIAGLDFAPSATAALRSGSYGYGQTPNPVMHTPTPQPAPPKSHRRLLVAGAVGALVVGAAGVVAISAGLRSRGASVSPVASVVVAAAPPASVPALPGSVSPPSGPQVVPVVTPVVVASVSAPVPVVEPPPTVRPAAGGRGRPRGGARVQAVEPPSPSPSPPPPSPSPQPVRPGGQARPQPTAPTIDIGY